MLSFLQRFNRRRVKSEVNIYCIKEVVKYYLSKVYGLDNRSNHCLIMDT